jgi:hypothetical protein
MRAIIIARLSLSSLLFMTCIDMLRSIRTVAGFQAFLYGPFAQAHHLQAPPFALIEKPSVRKKGSFQ